MTKEKQKLWEDTKTAVWKELSEALVRLVKISLNCLCEKFEQVLRGWLFAAA